MQPRAHCCHREKAREIRFHEVGRVENIRLSCGIYMGSHTPPPTEPSAPNWVAANLPQRSSHRINREVQSKGLERGSEWCKSVTDVTAAQPQPQTHLPHSLTEFGQKRGERKRQSTATDGGQQRLMWRYVSVAPNLRS